MTLWGFDAGAGSPTILGTNTPLAGEGDADSDADGPHRVVETVTDPELTAVVAAWPTLPEALRRAVMAIIGAAGPGTAQ